MSASPPAQPDPSLSSQQHQQQQQQPTSQDPTAGSDVAEKEAEADQGDLNRDSNSPEDMEVKGGGSGGGGGGSTGGGSGNGGGEAEASAQRETAYNEFDVKEQDRWLPIANVARIMKNALPDNAKIAKDAKECMQECVSEFISFITSEASEKCQQEKRKTVNGEDILFAMTSLGFENYAEALKIYLAKYRETQSTRSDNQHGQQQPRQGSDYGASGGPSNPAGLGDAAVGGSATPAGANPAVAGVGTAAPPGAGPSSGPYHSTATAPPTAGSSNMLIEQAGNAPGPYHTSAYSAPPEHNGTAEGGY